MRKMPFILCIMTILLIISACNEAETKDNSKNENNITPVQVAKVETGDFTVEHTLYGQLSPVQQTPVTPQQPGEITSLKVENGDYVKKDDHLATIKTQMGSQSIYASTEGEIAQLRVKENEFYTSETPLAMIIDTKKLQLAFSVTPSVRDQFEKDDELSVWINEDEQKAIVRSVDSLPDETGTYSIEAEIENDDQSILPGMIAEVKRKDVRVKDTIIVPTEAILTESDESFVYMVKNDVANKVKVEIQDTQTDKTAVKADLKKDDSIIISGQLTLTDGSKVDVVKEGS